MVAVASRSGERFREFSFVRFVHGDKTLDWLVAFFQGQVQKGEGEMIDTPKTRIGHWTVKNAS